jgi:hypothetical protein
VLLAEKGLLKSETMGIDAMLGQTPCWVEPALQRV